MPEDKITDPDVQQIVDDQKLANADKITKLKKMHEDERAIQRAATESPMAQDDGLNDRLHDITLALKDLGVDSKGPEDNLGATL
ncbi:hypothetical protein [Ahrensia marina]|uniref:Uncharacterized protein n=1 Tax=Ahrensia marina TaxID=1514904 RepID=A0A0N0E7W5_9HYPH|nr:hypothetical protein [Ahrensia marina]KPB01562.1 hypothetical protein SU32_08330 [Ahrensia marina]